jgi:peptidoglycan-associated lipoprotein
MTLKIRNAARALLGLSALVAIGCASTSTSPKNGAAPADHATRTTQSPEQVAIQPTAAPSLDPVYFDTDRWVLRADARTDLKVHAAAILQHPEWGVVTIQGHCDERGTDEYNVALGERRAAAVKRYLVDLGVPASRLATVTYGEERPAVAGHDETAWHYNRRSEFEREALQSATR